MQDEAFKRFMIVAERNFPRISGLCQNMKYVITEHDDKKYLHLLNSDALELLNKTQIKPLHEGLLFGTIYNETFEPSLPILYKYMSQKTDRWVVLKGFGAQHFLFGRNINSTSIADYSKGIRKESIVFVYDEERNPLGYGTATLNFIELDEEKTIAIKHVIDFGEYLRHR